MRLNGSTDKVKDRKELRTECETSFGFPARIKLSEIYFHEGPPMISKFVAKNEFIGAWEDAKFRIFYFQKRIIFTKSLG